MAELVTLLVIIAIIAIIVWSFSRTEFARQKMWSQFGVQLFVSVYGFGLAALGYWAGAGDSRALLGAVALSPGSLLLWFPFAGIPLLIVFWPYIGHLLASTRLSTYWFHFSGLMLLHYAGAFVWIYQDLQYSGLTQDLSTIWKHNPIGFTLFWSVYLLGQLMMWGYLIRQVRISRR